MAHPGSAKLLDPAEQGFGGQSRDQNYDALLDAMYANGKTVSTIGDKMWVPWFRTSSSCSAADLHSGNTCNSGQAIDFEHNCMVTDEFSQVGILVAMGKDQTRMDQFYNTVTSIASTNGKIPAWRVYRDGTKIEPCRQGINGNCDTASDATARIIIALYTASDNPHFADAARKAQYQQLATDLSNDFLTYEVDQTCRPSSLGRGDICYWLAAGSNAKRGGMASTDYAYTGYYADAIIAMLQACAQTGDQKFCRVAGNFTLNYLQAAKFDGNTFSVPPGRSFKWDTSGGVPVAVCTHTCNPDQWDSADAPRALGICQANYYADQVGVTLPGLERYCQLWGDKYMRNTQSAPYQYYTDGRNSAPYQSGYFAQGMQALFQAGYDPALFEPTLESALSHYTVDTKTWDHSACFGVYTQAFPIRALGFGIGRDEASFGAAPAAPPANPSTPPPATTPPAAPPAQTSGLAALDTSCVTGGSQCHRSSDTLAGSCRTVSWGTSQGQIQAVACHTGGDVVEVYKKSAPRGLDFTACIDAGCVNRYVGFVRFDATRSLSAGPASPPPAQGSIGALPYTCTLGAERCVVRSDVTDGSCRTVLAGTSRGDIRLKGCEKSSGYVELYLQQAPSGAAYRACLADGCVTEANGFARYLPGAVQAEPEEPITPPAPVDADPTVTGTCDVDRLALTSAGTKLHDVSDGSCRTVRFETPSGNVEAKVCEKTSGNYEMYLLTRLNQADVCVGDSCVGQRSGFASFAC